jgi:hypothetical protein
MKSWGETWRNVKERLGKEEMKEVKEVEERMRGETGR